MMEMITRLLYGNSQINWPVFRAINDSVRGGASTSYFTHLTPSSTAIFSGNLDITTLGGAGFSSQCTTEKLSFNRSTTAGLVLHLNAAPISEKSPTSFVLALKTEIPDDRPDGRRESITSYEYSWDMKRFEGETGIVRVEAKWDEFVATFRGRVVPDAEPLDTKSIRELSIMCRSNFAQQFGDFHLEIVDISVLLKPGQNQGRDWTLRLRDWWTRFMNYVKSLGGYKARSNGIRLP